MRKRLSQWCWRKIHDLHLFLDGMLDQNDKVYRLHRAAMDKSQEEYEAALKEVKELFGDDSPIVIRVQTLRSFLNEE